MSRKTRKLSRSKSYRSHRQLGHEQLEIRQLFSAAGLIPTAAPVDEVAIPAFVSAVEENGGTDGMTNLHAGVVSGNGTVGGNVNNYGGTISPGGSSAGLDDTSGYGTHVRGRFRDISGASGAHLRGRCAG